MEHKQILTELRARGLSYALVAAALGCTPQHVYRVADRLTESRRVALALAAAIGRPVEDVFPDIPRYAKPRNRDRERKEKVLALKRELKKKAA